MVLKFALKYSTERRSSRKPYKITSIRLVGQSKAEYSMLSYSAKATLDWIFDNPKFIVVSTDRVGALIADKKRGRSDVWYSFRRVPVDGYETAIIYADGLYVFTLCSSMVLDIFGGVIPSELHIRRGR